MFLQIMDEDTQEMIVVLLPVLTRCSQDTAEYLRQLLQILLVMIRPPTDPLLDIRHGISSIYYHTDTRFI